jgi:allantoin racemase
MPRLLLLNPNSTAAMTRGIAVAARAAAAAGTRIVARNPAQGPAAIEGPYDQAMCLQPLLAEVARGERDGCVATVIACFDDPGVAAARCLVRGPVLGIAQAAMASASLVAARFGIVTTVQPAVDGIEEMVQRYGAARACAGVLAAGVRVQALHRASAANYQRILNAALELLRSRRAEAIVLGCAGMSALGPRLARDLGVPVIDGVAAAVKLVEGLLAMQLSTSKQGSYATPLSGRAA